MRTTLDIDDDLLAAAEELARHEGKTVGQVISRWLREALTGRRRAPRSRGPERSTVAGFRPFAARSGVVAVDAQVDALRDAEGE